MSTTLMSFKDLKWSFYGSLTNTNQIAELLIILFTSFCIDHMISNFQTGMRMDL